MHVSRKLDLNRCYRAPAKKDRPALAACSEDQRARQVALARARARARAMIIIMGCPAPAIFEGRPAPLLPYCEARRSGRMARERSGEGRGEWEKKNAPVLTSRHSTPRICVYSSCVMRSLYRHADFRNTGFRSDPLFLPDPILFLPSVSVSPCARYAIRISSDNLRQR